jgi:catechol 2,3-dioxygenase-like lactoylglutathione lyase family enzyme
MQVASLDHLVLTVADIELTAQFYTRVLGMKTAGFGEGRVALCFGMQKINLHQHGHEFEPKAKSPTPGSADLCFLTSTPLNAVKVHLQSCGVEIEAGPVQRTGATGAILSRPGLKLNRGFESAVRETRCFKVLCGVPGTLAGR